MTTPHDNQTEAAERAYLRRLHSLLKAELQKVSEKVTGQFHDIIETKQYLHDSRADMDHVEKISVRQTIEQMSMLGEHRDARRKQLARLVNAPYFGRIDFCPHGGDAAQAIYIGVHSFYDHETDTQLIHDWRAPISSMFYDFETGEAWFEAPEGRTEGKLQLKRQYRIEKGHLVFMLESSLNIHDEVLQEELSRTSDNQMKNIVATIQRDQNAIIRNDSSKVLIIQGAAGSGKTSIALHRIAFLLYKFKDTISSDDMLIISPNEVFAHYIANVLPELGEETIQETTMEKLAAHLLEHKLKFETFSDQVAKLLEADAPDYAERIRFKASAAFLKKLDQYVADIRNSNVRALPIKVGRFRVPADFIEARFGRCGAMPYTRQVTTVTTDIAAWLKVRHGHGITSPERAAIRKQLGGMIREKSVKPLYQAFYDWLGAPGMFVPLKKSTYEYADIFPLVYLQMQIEGVIPHDKVKHLVVDEMQDYTPVQYRVLSLLFPCKMTILGDTHQSVNPFSASTAEVIREVMPGADCMYMHKSYRSTLEITELTQHINCNAKLIPIRRHGDPPEVIQCPTEADELRQIRALLRIFLDSEYKSMGIITKTQKQADALYEELRDLSKTIMLINTASTTYHNGVILATAHLAKGLEFDQVIVPHCTAANYNRPIDRHMLYVGCTRAMHELHLTCAAEVTPFLAGW